MKPAFQDMSIDQLRTYVLEHHDDKGAFETLVDRLKTNSSRVVYPSTHSAAKIILQNTFDSTSVRNPQKCDRLNLQF